MGTVIAYWNLKAREFHVVIERRTKHSPDEFSVVTPDLIGPKTVAVAERRRLACGEGLHDSGGPSVSPKWLWRSTAYAAHETFRPSQFRISAYPRHDASEHDRIIKYQ